MLFFVFLYRHIHFHRKDLKRFTFLTGFFKQERRQSLSTWNFGL
jgi:hypothetical protein